MALMLEAVMLAPISEAELLEKITAIVKAAGGTVTAQDAHAVNGTLTAITSKWFLGGRKVVDSVTCRLEFGTFRDAVDQVARDAGWRFVVDL